jgi:nucleotide-binding universal stress UspA family protein
MPAQRPKRTAAPSPKRILLATDFSPYADTALRWADAVSKAFGAKLIIVHALDLTLGGLAGLGPEVAAFPVADQLVDLLREEAKTEMARLAKRLPRAQTTIREGPPRSTLLQVASEVRADLIVVGTQGRTGLAHMLIGSVAEHLVRHSRIPVLTVRLTEPA